MRIKIKTHNRKTIEGHISLNGQTIQVKTGGKTYSFKLISSPAGEFIVEDENGVKYRINGVYSSSYETVFEINGKSFRAEFITSTSQQEEEDENISLLKSSFSGLVRKVFVRKNQKVKKGEVLMELESMKMINSLKSPIDGTVEEIFVSEGKTIVSGEKLIKIVKNDER